METVREYPNGSSEVVKVVDEPGVPEKPAWDEYEDVLRYIPFTDRQMAERRAAKAQAALSDAQAAQMLAAASIAVAAMPLDDGQASAVSMLIPEWSPSRHYEEGDVCRRGGGLHRCRQAHDPQEPWTPEAAPSLWQRIGEPVGGVWPWIQRDDGYGPGDVVAFEGSKWRSAIPGNVWMPGVYGWDAIEESEGRDPE